MASGWVKWRDKTYFLLGALLVAGGIVFALTGIVRSVSPPHPPPPARGRQP